MKKSQLEFLIRQIVNEIISSSDLQKVVDQNPGLDSSTPPEDAMTAAEKARLDREADIERQKSIKVKTGELDAKKKEMEFNKKKLDQQKRFDVPNAAKELQRLKGAQI
jgi:hypothetical protein